MNTSTAGNTPNNAPIMGTKIRVISRLFTYAAIVVWAVVASSLLYSPARADTLGPIQNYGNKLCMQPKDNSAQSSTLIVQERCAPSAGRNLFQEWDAICKNAQCSVFYWKNRGSGLCLRARGLNGAANGLQMMLWACNKISDVTWVYGKSPVSGTFALESRIGRSKGYCLDVPGASSQPGVELQLYKCNHTSAQLWQAPSPIIE